jgi:hypothetical protein
MFNCLDRYSGSRANIIAELVPDFVIGPVTESEPLPKSIRACKIPVTGPG